MSELTRKTTAAIKWSSLTELLSKMITPVVNMILARILAPEAFGILATITMVLSFGEVFAEAGFQKYLIQHDFESKEAEQKAMSVAFWANLAFSCFVWALIAVFSDPLAAWAGNAGLGFPLAVASVAVPLYGVIGIQNCQLKKRLEFKPLFWVRLLASCVPLLVTVPLAVLGLDYWSLIIGNIASLLLQSLLLALLGKFKPSRYFSWRELKQMLSVGVWTLLDGLAVWLTVWIDSLLISQWMSDYYLGLYKNATSTITALFAIITAALTPVLFSSLSKLQNDQPKFKSTFLNMQKLLNMLLLPLSVGTFLYRDFVTMLLFGEQWTEAADIVGVMALSTALRTIYISIYSEAYRAKGHFRVPLILQLVDISMLIPVCMIFVGQGFWPLVYARAIVRLDLIIPEMILLWKLCGISPGATLKTVAPSVAATAAMILTGCMLQLAGSGILWTVASVLLCCLVYFAVLALFQSERRFLKDFIRGE